MSSWKTIAVVSLLAGCAGVQPARGADDQASGRWTGEIERAGWRQTVTFDLARDGGAWRGQWQPSSEHPGEVLENVDVQGSDVRFETENLRVIGHVKGSHLIGTVTDKAEDAPVGQLAVTNQQTFTPSPEWAPPTLDW